MNVAGRPLQKTAPWPSGNGRGSYLSEGVRTWFWWKNPGVLDLPDPMTQRCEEAHPFETLASQSSQLHGPRGDTRSHLCSLERSTWYSTKRDHLTLPFPSSCPVRCARDREGYFADRLYKSMTGAGTDEETLIHVFVTRAEVRHTRLHSGGLRTLPSPPQLSLTKSFYQGPLYRKSKTDGFCLSRLCGRPCAMLLFCKHTTSAAAIFVTCGCRRHVTVCRRNSCCPPGSAVTFSSILRKTKQRP